MKKGDGMMVLIETPADAAVTLRPDRRERLWLQPEWQASMQRWAYPRRVAYRFSPGGGYVALAKMYRAYARENGLLKTMAEKAAERPRVAWLKGTAVVWGSDGLKFAGEARAAGIRHAIVYRRFEEPTDLPAADVKAITDLGFLVAEYDDLDECTEGMPCFGHDSAEVAGVRTADGKPIPGWGGKGFVRSSALGLQLAQTYMPPPSRRSFYRPVSGRDLDRGPLTGKTIIRITGKRPPPRGRELEMGWARGLLARIGDDESLQIDRRADEFLPHRELVPEFQAGLGRQVGGEVRPFQARHDLRREGGVFR